MNSKIQSAILPLKLKNDMTVANGSGNDQSWLTYFLGLVMWQLQAEPLGTVVSFLGDIKKKSGSAMQTGRSLRWIKTWIFLFVILHKCNINQNTVFWLIGSHLHILKKNPMTLTAVEVSLFPTFLESNVNVLRLLRYYQSGSRDGGQACEVKLMWKGFPELLGRL